MGSKCYLANTGDSRAILSCDRGKNVLQISKDHKPNDPKEKARILESGGSLYIQCKKIVRISPSTLSVSRTFGDIRSKLTKYGGKKAMIISDPDIIKFNIEPRHDFILMGSDGLFDKITNEELIKVAWKRKGSCKDGNQHKVTGKVIDSILNAAIANMSLDNITAIMICFDGFWDLKRDSFHSIKNVYKKSISPKITRIGSTQRRYTSKYKDRIKFN